MLTTGLVHGKKTGAPVGACPVKGCNAHSVEAPEPLDMDCVWAPATWNAKLAVLLFPGTHAPALACTVQGTLSTHGMLLGCLVHRHLLQDHDTQDTLFYLCES